MWSRPGKIRVEGSAHTVAKAINIKNTVDRYGFFENQLDGGTYMTFDQTISGQHVQSICTNFNGNPTFGSYIKINGVLLAGDQRGLAPDGVDTRTAPFQMARGHTMIIMNSHGAVQSTNCYDTYGNAGLCSTMATALHAMPAGWVVAIGTYDATSCTQALRDAFTNYFGDNAYPSTSIWNSVRISQMFLGKRNSTA